MLSSLRQLPSTTSNSQVQDLHDCDLNGGTRGPGRGRAAFRGFQLLEHELTDALNCSRSIPLSPSIEPFHQSTFERIHCFLCSVLHSATASWRPALKLSRTEECHELFSRRPFFPHRNLDFTQLRGQAGAPAWVNGCPTLAPSSPTDQSSLTDRVCSLTAIDRLRTHQR